MTGSIGKKMRSVSFQFCINLTDKSLQILSLYCNSLEEIILDGCIQLTDIGIEMLSKSCNQLKTLSLEGCKRLTDVSLFLLSNNKCIETLNIAGCHRISDHGIEMMALSITELQIIDISKCRSLTQKSVIYIFSHSKKLRLLKAVGMKNCFDSLCLDLKK